MPGLQDIEAQRCSPKGQLSSSAGRRSQDYPIVSDEARTKHRNIDGLSSNAAELDVISERKMSTLCILDPFHQLIHRIRVSVN